MKRITDSFTSLRGIACVLVILCHESFSSRKQLKALEDMGGISVCVFFVLSAYLLTRNMLMEIIPDLNKPPRNILNMSLIKYIIRRFMRIYPALAVAAIINYYFLCSAGANQLCTWDAFERIKETLLVRVVDNHLWTLKVEMAFYFYFLPIFGVFASLFLSIDYYYMQKRRIKTFHIYILLITLYFLWMQLKTEHVTDLHDKVKDFSVEWIVFWYGSLAGILSHYMNSYRPKFDSRMKIALWEISSYVLLLRIIFSSKALASKYLGYSPTVMTWWQSVIAIAPFIALLLLLLEFSDTNLSLGSFLSARYLICLGKYSYSTYLLHYACIRWYLNKTEFRGFDETIIILIACNFFGFLQYTFVEEPCFKLSKYIILYLELLVQKIRGSHQSKSELAKHKVLSSIEDSPLESDESTVINDNETNLKNL